MLSELTSAHWQVIACGIFVMSSLLGYAADSILGESGFGPARNAVLYASGGTAGLFILDAAIRSRMIYGGHVEVYHWMAAWFAMATVLLLGVAVGRKLLVANLDKPWVATVAFMAPLFVTVGLTVRTALNALH